MSTKIGAQFSEEWYEVDLCLVSAGKLKGKIEQELG